ncbi:type II toxin-antitoxin system Phd/YefM family antitoxin [Rhodothermus marinus]|uniref:type II toxin-antitoxin system Phd/YefM family antitoxin n=1 Tax=Rhodothermus marinus TaxID=29549 RepID=UPI0012BA3BC0|nr:type II toxin-antitoxin system prevent-host-death family antitoxin [Rhodothermus marinus]BBM68510.1 antitoxin [Rhodothermus marinus]BBM71478.1 antitoxin [Rhodothermus marinus]
MRVVNIREARVHLSRLIAAVEQGEEVIIMRAGRPVARLVPLRKPRKLGVLAGRMTIPEDFDAPLPEKILSAFEGNA